MENDKLAQHVSLKEAQAMGPPPEGNLAVPILRHGSMEAELYSPVDLDHQKPHERDEIYVVAQGEGEFFNGGSVIKVVPGSFIFVPAGTPHYFQNFTPGFSVWVVFYGPKGGESNV